ncbi:hypothetical protein EVG20_g9761 [Dentipellis fragilis]|uniref:DDE Tnp4 domain-containing protein n=1 Tax=Dentipellis fragilis TaxID=205917 RepID=A0A4Y9XYS1_9AGAM|nr:hypothetical protein EVG20_g9761 [Dentipellis fragilis]
MDCDYDADEEMDAMLVDEDEMDVDGGEVEMDDGGNREGGQGPDGVESDGSEFFWVEEEELCGPSSSNLGRKVRIMISNLYAHCYQAPREHLPRAPADLPYVLSTLKEHYPYRFRQQLRVTPYTFDHLVAELRDDPIFSNNSNCLQIPVDHQVALVLYRFGRYGNGASHADVAAWAGVGEGTVTLVTQQVITALLHRSFMKKAVQFPTAEEKEAAKQWVEDHFCRAWRNGFLFIDGTLVPLFDRPFWYGESYFDRKCNYSLNIQIISLPNLRIIDFGYGFTGSTHNATAWHQTRLPKEHQTILEHGEFVWADSAYPISTWVVTPYKRPLHDIRENEVFNNHVSMLRIRSEHVIGFLKGRFQSLKSLHVRICDEATHQFATQWVVACIATHAFAMQCEAEEHGDDQLSDDSFIGDGLSSDEDANVGGTQQTDDAKVLTSSKAWWEWLKGALFRSKERCMEYRRSHRR